ncbi:MAG: hypothetical protein ACI8XU_001106 [Kiritimatiellia bacterium]|jgi:hypothetical protein
MKLQGAHARLFPLSIQQRNLVTALADKSDKEP